MAGNRAKKSGLSLEAHNKMQAKYDNGLEVEIRQFFKEVLGEELEPKQVGSNYFQQALKNGVKLCELMNAIEPGSIKKIDRSAMVFKQMENINNFNKAIQKYGVPETSLFQTTDLTDNMDMATVQIAIWQLACQYRKKGGKAKLGVNMSDPNKRDFDEETMKQGSNVISLQYGTNKGASQAGMTSMGMPRKL